MPITHMPATAAQKRQAAYKKAQDLYHRDPTLLEEKVITGQSLLEEQMVPDLVDVKTLYEGIFSSRSPPDIEPVADPKTSDLVYRPIDRDKIVTLTKNWSNSSPGPDGILVPQVKRCPAHMLKALFNVILYRRHIPSLWLQSRTILIYKEGDRKNPTNWRPITIGSAVQRLLHRILARRLPVAVPFDPRQRGLRNIDGTLANILLLDHYIKSRRLARKSCNIVSLDIRKAFDSVSHHSILRALDRFGVHHAFTDYISTILQGAYTTISVGHQTTGPIEVRRGVKQGDPLSPVLFNMVLDELVCGLKNESNGGTIAPGSQVAAVAFADDLVLLQDRDLDMTLALDKTLQFCAARGMTLNPTKSVAIFATVFEGRSVVRTKPVLRIAGSFIPSLQDLSTIRYLGLPFGSTGLRKPSVHHLSLWLKNLEKTPLKPDQKFGILKTYLLPRLHFGFQSPATTEPVLSEGDRRVRKWVKRILHLSQ